MVSQGRTDVRAYPGKQSGPGDEEGEGREVAARTVNKQRRTEGRTPARSSQGTGNPNARLQDRSRQELYNLAKSRDIAGRSRMNKQELVEALRSR